MLPLLSALAVAVQQSGPAPLGPTPAPAPPAATPQQRAEQLAERFVEAYNSADTAVIRAFIESSIVATPDRTVATRLQLFLRVYEAYGALTVVAMQPGSGDEVVLELASQRGQLTMNLIPSAAQPGRIQSVSFTVTGGTGPP